MNKLLNLTNLQHFAENVRIRGGRSNSQILQVHEAKKLTVLVLTYVTVMYFLQQRLSVKVSTSAAAFHTRHNLSMQCQTRISTNTCSSVEC